MNNRSKSETKLKQVYTPRIKDGRASNDFKFISNKQQNNQKIAGVFNPETPRQAGKNNNIKKIVENNSNAPMDKWDFIQTEAGSPMKKQHGNFMVPKPTKARDKEHKYVCVGRNLQYPQERVRNVKFKKQQTQQSQHQKQRKSSQVKRSQSASCIIDSKVEQVSRTKKSQQIKQKYAQKQEKIKVAMNYLLQNNQQYLTERSRMCQQKARPKSAIFNFNQAKILTTYIDHYPPKQAKFDFEVQAQNQKMSLLISPSKVCGNSTSNEFHNGVQGERRKNAEWPQGFKLQGPMDSVTTYMNKFPNHGDFQKMVPIATWNQHPIGLKFSPETTHRKHYKGQKRPRADLATWNNMHPYGNDFDHTKPTTYKSAHNSKQKQPIQQWPNYDPRLIVSKGKFSTQYKSQMKNYHQHQIHDANRCKCGTCRRTKWSK